MDSAKVGGKLWFHSHEEAEYTAEWAVGLVVGIADRQSYLQGTAHAEASGWEVSCRLDRPGAGGIEELAHGSGRHSPWAGSPDGESTYCQRREHEDVWQPTGQFEELPPVVIFIGGGSDRVRLQRTARRSLLPL